MAQSSYPLTNKIETTAKLFQLAGDPTRLRILTLMFDKGEACVSDIASCLDMSMANTSHHLQVMRDNGLFETQRDGNHICYRLVKNEVVDHIKKMMTL